MIYFFISIKLNIYFFLKKISLLKINIYKFLYQRKVLNHNKYDENSKKKCFFISWGSLDNIPLELLTLKSLEKAGYDSYLVLPDDYKLYLKWKKYLDVKIISLSKFLTKPDINESLKYYKNLKSFKDLLLLNKNEIPFGKYVYSTSLRGQFTNDIQIDRLSDKLLISWNIIKSLMYLNTFNRALEILDPQKVYMIDNNYTPNGEIFEISIKNKLDVITVNASHKNNAVIFKKYNSQNKYEHPYGIEEKNWKKIKEMTFTDKHWFKLKEEYEKCYSTGDWYASAGTSVNKNFFSKDKIIEHFNFINTKKIGVIFSHIFWDATFFWGKNFFEDYEDWLIQTIKEAQKNDNIQWIVKVHPSNITKMKKINSPNFSELNSINKKIGKLPEHIKIMLPDTPINTYSLFQSIDYCITVRGTVGIEASSFGVTTITGGESRYSRKGFTSDSNNDRDYLEKLRKIEDLPPMTEQQINLARKFAYSSFFKQPVQLNSIKFEYTTDYNANQITKINHEHIKDFETANDLNFISDWIESEENDCINFNG